MTKKFLSEIEAAEFLALSVKTLRRWRLLNNIGPRYRKFGSAVRYDSRDLERYVETSPTGGQAGEA